MRLCRPSFHVDAPVRLDPSDLIIGEDIFNDPIAASRLPPLIDAHATKLTDSSALPHSSSNTLPIHLASLAEIQTERQRILPLDTSKTPVESIRAGERYHFIVEHDVEELGAHTFLWTWIDFLVSTEQFGPRRTSPSIHRKVLMCGIVILADFDRLNSVLVRQLFILFKE
ncbi:hypothetical protein GH714_002111 [Hevea brasiliensis]|uniref:Uncharacterized protein n=1 Tax=Hevea brasiliensis TaxID=3981 RepID=A0A6A6LUQ6_HEVBR|nr:hypothetical protein GH714_002111 [Hevea brasiliensis]